MGVSLRTYELAQMQSELHSCLELLDGTARLRPLEPVLQLDFVFDRRGHVNVVGVAQTLGPHKSTLSFSFDSDQSYLAETDRQLQAILLKVPHPEQSGRDRRPLLALHLPSGTPGG
jgi:hypothetical protein